MGVKAKESLQSSRSSVAMLINASPEEIYFTSGGSESINLALKGICMKLWKNNSTRKKILISSM